MNVLSVLTIGKNKKSVNVNHFFLFTIVFYFGKSNKSKKANSKKQTKIIYLQIKMIYIYK